MQNDKMTKKNVKEKGKKCLFFLKACLISCVFGTIGGRQAQKLSTSKDKESSSVLLRIELLDSYYIYNFSGSASKACT